MKEPFTKVGACRFVLLCFLGMFIIYVAFEGMMKVRASGGLLEPSGSSSVFHAK
ncbi:hypothetical protein [Acidipila sp. EB88]|uniref:hypothetical protein n=1 Tax=Acidipila sp. EB88 TaxID=2305226 RepID=UPI0013155991|nr:hypothetical protein [Acidipila sp. EB88]